MMIHRVKVMLSLGICLLGALNPDAETPTANEIAKLLASDGTAGDRFGGSVAVDGDTAVIGAHYDGHENGVITG